MDADVQLRLRRLRAAIGDTEESKLEELPPRIVVSDRGILVQQDFNGNLSEEQLLNHAHAVIHQIASMTDNLKRWAAKTDRDKSKVDETLQHSEAIKLLTDIWNLEKHGAPDRSGGLSRKSPRLVDVHRGMEIRTGSTGVWTGITMGPKGLVKFGDGNAVAKLDGDIIDSQGRRIASLQNCIREALSAWEALIMAFGLPLDPEPLP
ncbi:MAG: hypothetical protein JNL96_24425 [Planctomycetaceae bacterium]|nr:hypothetical protein [Planctomycetaceae bacterium]